jgi:hypothetical protein
LGSVPDASSNPDQKLSQCLTFFPPSSGSIYNPENKATRLV